MQFSDYQNLVSSEKVTLAVLSASKRLMGWALHSGSVYKLTNFEFAVIASLEDSGTGYTEVTSLGAVTAGKFYLDRAAKTLYVRTTGSDNPNGRFLVGTVKLFFANVPITLPYDLSTGFEVFWEPLVRSTSEFGVAIDTINQTSESIEGSGTLTLNNDYEFWPTYFDKLSFENQPCILYSYHRDLDPSDAKYIFKGKVEKKAYGKDSITFQLKDQFAELRSNIQLDNIGDIVGARVDDSLADAKQRMLIGRVFVTVPTNIDQVLDGYPATGTVSVVPNSLTLNGTGTAFLTELSPDDRVVLNGEEYTIASVTDNTTATLTEVYSSNATLDNVVTYIVPDQPKRYMNRVFKVAGHVLRRPQTTTVLGTNILTLKVASTRDFYAGDVIFVGSEMAVVKSVIGSSYIKLTTSLATVPTVGTTVTRPAIQNVKIDNTPLEYGRDYSFDNATSVLTLTDDAEANAGAIYQMASNVTFTNGSRTVTGSGFLSTLKPGYMLGVVGRSTFFEVLAVVDDSTVQLRSPSTFSDIEPGRYKSLIYNPDESVLTLDCLGRTDDGTSSGILVKTAPAISKMLLQDAGLTSELNSVSFDDAEEIAYQDIGLTIPANFDATETPIYRDVLNKVNKSVFGAIVQNGDFEFTYQVLRPHKDLTAPRFSEADLISYSMVATAENVIATAIVTYGRREYDPISKDEAVYTQQKTSDYATYVVKTDRSKTIETYLVEEDDADIMSKRWAFLLRNSAGRLTFKTKLQGATLEIGDIVEVEHRKFFQRFGSTSKRKLLMVESVTRNGSEVNVIAADLSNTFNRVAAINTYTANWSTASEEERLYGGYITDQYGLIANDPNSLETNLIW